MSVKRTLLVSTLFFSHGCMTIHAVGGSSTPGEVYIAAQRSALGFPGQPFVVRCQDRATKGEQRLTCERILTGRDLAALAPRKDRTETYPGTTIFGASTAGRPAGGESADRPAADATVDPLLDRVYRELGMSKPDARTLDRDRLAVKGLLGSMTADEVVAALRAARDDVGQAAPVYALAMRAHRSDDEIDFESDEE